MNYRKHYNRLIRRARNRKLCGYSERHHVVPRCMGGGNEESNLVRLTPEEHYVAHLLLVKIYPGNHKLLWAAVAMTNGTEKMPRKNKLYGWLRRQLGKTMSGRLKGRKFSIASRLQMGQSRLGVSRGPHKNTTKQKISIASKGKRKSIAHRLALSEAAKKRTDRRKHTKAARLKMSRSQKQAALTRNCSHMQSRAYRELQSVRTTMAWKKRKAELSSIQKC